MSIAPVQKSFSFACCGGRQVPKRKQLSFAAATENYYRLATPTLGEGLERTRVDQFLDSLKAGPLKKISPDEQLEKVQASLDKTFGNGLFRAVLPEKKDIYVPDHAEAVMALVDKGTERIVRIYRQSDIPSRAQLKRSTASIIAETMLYRLLQNPDFIGLLSPSLRDPYFVDIQTS